MAGIKIVDLPALGRDLISTDLLEVSLNGSGSRKITGQEIMNASKLAVGSTPIVSGTVGRLLFQNTGDVLGQSANLFWDNTNGRLGIGTSSPLEQFHMANTGAGTNTVLRMSVNPVSVNVISFRDTGGAEQGAILGTGAAFNFGTYRTLQTSVVGGGGGVGLRTGNGANAHISFYSGNAEANLSTETMRLVASTGNLLINTTTDAGYKLDVNGTARVKTDLKIETATGGLTIEGDAGGYPTLKINTLRSGTTRRNWMFATEQFNGGDFVLFRSATGGGAANTLVYSIFNNGNVGINTTTDDGFKLDVNGTARVNGLVTATLSNYNSTHLGNTTRGFYIVNSSDSIVRAGIEYDGTNAFVQLAGRYGNGAAFFRQNGGNGDISFLRNGVEYGRIFGATGNWGINTTTDAGYKLDVNGTARVVNTLAVNTGNTNGQGVQIGSDSNSGIYLVSGATQFRQYSSAFEFAGLGTNVFLRTDSTRLSTRANYGISLGTYAASTPEPSAILQAVSTTQGFLPPRMTNAQRAAIASPAVGLIVYCTDSTEGLYVYKSTGWTFMV